MKGPPQTSLKSESGVVSFDFYSYHVTVKSDSDGILEDVRRDFSYFRSPPSDGSVQLEVTSESVPHTDLSQIRATLHTPRNVVYRDGDISYLDYFGRGLLICQDEGRVYRIYCEDRDLAHEIAFLTILSQVGQHLDAIGLHRVHALGIEAGGRAVLILLPIGGGKTTLALRILRSEGMKLLSEDSPLISRSGTVFPFPIRIGIRVGEEPSGIPSEYMRTVKRMEFDPKTLIDIAYFRKKIGEPCPIGSILLGERWLAGHPFIRPENRRAAIKAFIKNSVVGLGLYQGVEFVLERSALEILGKAGLAFSRFRNSLEVIRRSQVYRFAMGPDVEQNADVLIRFIREFSSHSQS